MVGLVPGDPVILHNVSGLKEDRLYAGQKGWAANTVVVDEEEYVFFQPEDSQGVFVIEASRVELDAEEKERIEREGGGGAIPIPPIQ